MIRSGFLTPSQRRDLEEVVRSPREDHGIARRANAILLLDDGKSYQQIADFLYLDDETVRRWHRAYLAGGFDWLATFDWKGGFSRLSAEQETQLCDWLDERMCRDTNEIRAFIELNFRVTYSRSGLGKLLHRLGYEYRKPKALPKVADEKAQQDFIDLYEKLLRQLGNDEAVYFADAVHPEYQTRPQHGWVKKGHKVAVKTTSGRQRLNIHGALNLENFDAPLVEAETINGDSAVSLLKKIEARNWDKTVIYVIWDNAAYHRCEVVRKWLARPDCRIRLIQLPPYAPHLNPIERLWGVLHEYSTHNKFHKDFNAFAAAILKFFRETIPKEWKTFRDKVTDNFRIISHQDFRIFG